MMNYTKWNDPKTYERMTAELAAYTVPETPIFAARDDEHIEHSRVQYCMTSVDELRELLGSVDYAIVEQVACSKYLNSLQIFEYITLRGYDVDRPKLRKRILKLMKYRVIQENEMVSAGAEHGLKYYELDYFGYQLALEQGVNFHMATVTCLFQREERRVCLMILPVM